MKTTRILTRKLLFLAFLATTSFSFGQTSQNHTTSSKWWVSGGTSANNSNAELVLQNSANAYWVLANHNGWLKLLNRGNSSKKFRMATRVEIDQSLKVKDGIEGKSIDVDSYFLNGVPISFDNASVNSFFSARTNGISYDRAVTIGSNKNPINGTKLHVDGRVYISENGGSEQGFSDQTHENYKNYLLWVEEGIVAKNVVIGDVGDFPDYVFDKSYGLPSLKEIEKHIKNKGHLHTFRSAQEYQKDGYTVSEINNNMIKTIEELTLHTINQEKKIEELERKLLLKDQAFEVFQKRLDNIEKQNQSPKK